MVLIFSRSILKIFLRMAVLLLMAVPIVFLNIIKFFLNVIILFGMSITKTSVGKMPLQRILILNVLNLVLKYRSIGKNVLSVI